MNKRNIFFTALASLIIGIVIGKVLPDKEKSSNPASQDYAISEVRESGYRFISPLLECETGKDYYRLNGLNPLQKQLREFVDAEKRNGTISHAAIYFRDLNNGPWFGVNEHDNFSPASLLKLPVMMAYFKKAETDTTLLNKKVKYEEKNLVLDQSIPPSTAIQMGNVYAIEELIERMITYSDNAALFILEKNIEPMLLDKITLDLGVETATDATPLDFMSVKGYAGLFRILYNASYIEKSLSEKALEILSRTRFNEGIVSGVPKGIVVAHKFGERELSQNVVQLHDCGIVYSKKSPYLLCIMTRGSNLNNLKRVLATISDITYKGIESRVAN